MVYNWLLNSAINKINFKGRFFRCCPSVDNFASAKAENLF